MYRCEKLDKTFDSFKWRFILQASNHIKRGYLFIYLFFGFSFTLLISVGNNGFPALMNPVRLCLECRLKTLEI